MSCRDDYHEAPLVREHPPFTTLPSREDYEPYLLQPEPPASASAEQPQQPISDLAAEATDAILAELVVSHSQRDAQFLDVYRIVRDAIARAVQHS